MTLNSTYTIEPNYREAINRSDEGLPPLAVKLLAIPELDFPPGFEVYKECNKEVLIAMTTVFMDEEFRNENKWGWCHLESGLKEQIGELLRNKELRDEWVYLSQRS